MKYGNKLKELRRIKKESQATVARKVGIGRSTLSDYENDRYPEPKISVLRKLCNYYGINPDEFIFKGNITLDISDYTPTGKQKALLNHIAEKKKKYEEDEDDSEKGEENE